LVAVGGWPTLAPAQTGLQDHAKHERWDRMLKAAGKQAGGDWPWGEMLRSPDLGDSLLATLAAGMAGAPAVGNVERAPQSWRESRSDGALIRPDSTLTIAADSLLPDSAENKAPMVAWAYTADEAQRTAYVFCYARSNEPEKANFTTAEFGFSGEVMVLNRGTGAAWREPADEAHQASLYPRGIAYFEVAPIRANGLVFFGDQGKYVSNGRQRIAAISSVPGGIAVTVIFAKGENAVTVFGFAPRAPKLRTRRDKAGEIAYDSGAGRFSVQISPSVSETSAGGRLREAEVEIVMGGPD
jgi:hypothetical protein